VKKMAIVISFANQKGGVGKTTTAINIAASLAAINKRVLLIDMDSQGNAGTGLGFVRAAHKQNVYDVLMENSKIEENILTTAVKNMHILPASAKLAGAELDMLDLENREYRLNNALETISNNYDFILIDCPPALGILTINALTASDYVIIPLQCEFFALEGVQQLLSTIQAIKQKWNPDLDILGMVLTMYDKKLGLTKAVEEDVRNTFGDKVFKTIIPRNVRVSEAPSHGKPALFYDFKSTGAQAYLRVATEVVNALEKRI